MVPALIFAIVIPLSSMQTINSKSLSRFFIAGISYEKTNTTRRSIYTIDDEAYLRLIQSAKKAGIPEIFILSTCNRTEIYGFVTDPGQLIDLLCSETKGDATLFRELAYIKQGNEAIHQLYCVAAGLDSQILGDYEIISQVKHSTKFAKEHEALGTFTERLINSVLQVSKQIKNETKLSAGTVSVSFAVVQYLKHLPDIKTKNILLLGVGKIGRNTCKNMIKHLGTGNITLINRTHETAAEFAQTYGLPCAPYEQLSEYLSKADIILVATNAKKPTILKKDISKRTKLILDLSIPHNVAEEVKTLPGLQVINVDDLSQVQDHTLEVRKKEIPKALAIIDDQMKDFLYWHQMRKHAIVLQAMKKKIEQIHRQEIKNQKRATNFNKEDMEEVSNRIVQKMVNVFAGKLRKANGQAENYVQMLGEIFEIPAKE